MYTSYSTLQRKQLSKQVYTDTQSTYLLVYAPGRHQALEHALENQLHRKFRLVDRLEGELTPSVNGVLLVSEDVECTSTALTYFAAALQQGADLVVCDAVFGYDGGSALYQTDQHLPGQRCALLSRALLDRCRAAARGKDDVLELLRLANQLAQNCRCVPQALLHFRRELCAEDVFSATGKRAVVLSHELTMTGAPIVLVSAVPVLRSMGYEVVVLGPEDGGSMPLFLEAGATVITRKGCVQSPLLWGLALCADLVLANTVVEARAVRALSGARVPVLWWLHDAFAGYPFISHSIPKALGKNIHVCAVGSHATAAMHSVRPDFAIEQLIYGLPDYAAEQFPRYDISFAGGRPLFVTVGSLEHRKGPDIFCNAIRLLPSAVREKAVFLFVGKAADKGMYSAVDSLVRDYPQTVFYRKRLERPEVKSLMEQCNCVVCASRDDPMPTFVTEGLIFGKPSIVSEHTGTAGVITEGVDGFTYPDDDPQKLAALLEWAIFHPEKLAAMKAAGYDGIELCGFMIHPIGFMVRLLTKAAGMPVGKGGNLDWHALVKEAGLQVVSLHTDLGSLERDAKAVADEAKSFGTKYVVITGMYRFDYGDEATMHDLAARLNKAGEALKAEGVELLYHNHNCELRHVNAEKRAYDILLEETDPQFVNFEFDSYWFTEGGANALAWMQRLGPRMKLWHINDRGTRITGSAITPILKTDSMELGTGNMDLDSLMAQALAVEVDAVILESHRNWVDNSPIKSLQLSAEYLKQHG